MAEPTDPIATEEDSELLESITEEGQAERACSHVEPFRRWLVIGLLVSWSVFQLLLPKVLLLDQIQVRAIHLAFAITVTLLAFPVFKKGSRFARFNTAKWMVGIHYLLAIGGGLVALYVMWEWKGISERAGLPTTRDIWVGLILILLLLESARRVIGPALSVICVVFSVYVFFAPWMPGIFAFKAASVSKFMSKVVLSTEGIYGLPLDVSANTVFLYVLLGAMLAKVGAGHFFNEVSLALLGRFRGGPAKAAVVSSGLTGLVSGSSIANVVTTGTFTIPLMKRVGYPGKIAAATEVAASTNGQLMPPIMGAAAFIIAEYLGMSYVDVIKAAAIPAVVSYIALFYITHLEACKLGMRGLSRDAIPALLKTLKNGFHFLVPIAALLVELIWLRHTPKLAAFNAIIALVIVVLIKNLTDSFKGGQGFAGGVKSTGKQVFDGLVDGSWNMLSVALATAAAGIVVGIVTMGIGSMIVQVVEKLSMGNLFLLLLITAVASLILGMGLPTTATYIVMASITVPVIVNLGAHFGFNPIPAIAAHLFCFYFGILADDTPPVGLAAYAAAAIAKSKPIPTGIQGFIYDLRTAVIPFMFVFNPELLLVGVHSIPHTLLIIVTATLGALSFTNAVQGWALVKNRWFEVPPLLFASLLFFWPQSVQKVTPLNNYTIYALALALYAGVFAIQKLRSSQDSQSSDFRG